MIEFHQFYLYQNPELGWQFRIANKSWVSVKRVSLLVKTSTAIIDGIPCLTGNGVAALSDNQEELVVYAHR